MRQRAAVARALAMEPSVLLMDEPFAAFDVQTRSKLQDFLIQVWRGQRRVGPVRHSPYRRGHRARRPDRGHHRAAWAASRALCPSSCRGRATRETPYSTTLRDHLMDLLADEVDRAFAEQEKIKS